MGKWLRRLREKNWDKDVRRYGRIPGDVLRRQDVSNGAKVLFVTLDMLSGKKGKIEGDLAKGIAKVLDSENNKGNKQ